MSINKSNPHLYEPWGVVYTGKVEWELDYCKLGHFWKWKGAALIIMPVQNV